MVTFLKKQNAIFFFFFFLWISGFLAIDDLPCAHWDETEFRLSSCSLNLTCSILVPPCISTAVMIHWTKDSTSNVPSTSRLLFINNEINCHIVIYPNVSAEKCDLGTDAGGGSQSYRYSFFLESMSILIPPRYSLSIHIWFADSSYHAYQY